MLEARLIMKIASHLLQNITGHFLLPGRLDVPFIYCVRRTRDGGIYCLRQIDAYQLDEPLSSVKLALTPCFVATASFKRQEEYGTVPTPHLPQQPIPPLKYIPWRLESLPSDHLIRTFPQLAQAPTSHDHAPSADFSWYVLAARSGGIEDSAPAFPGVEMRKPDLEPWHEQNGAFAGMSPGPSAYRLLHVYRIIEDDGADPPDLLGLPGNEHWDKVNLHAAAHLYASDRNGLFLIARALGFGSGNFRITSLSHSVVFHAPPEEFLMANEDGSTRWFVQEAWTSVGGGNRGMHESRLWRWNEESKQGALVAGTWQDGMVRLTGKNFLGGGDEKESDGKSGKLGKERRDRAKI